jgi:carbon-monoxide dehydrogenase large subunit
VRHAGEAVAMVVAETAAAARDAAELVDVDYEQLVAVVSAEDAVDERAPQLWDDIPENLALDVNFGAGDVEAARAIAGSDVVIEHQFVNQRIVAAQMEPRAAVGSYDETKGYALISGTQGVTRHKAWIAETLGVAPERVQVLTYEVGGSFGVRQFLHPEDLLVVWAARRVGRPVRWQGDRSEDFMTTYQGRDMSVQASLGVANDGRIRGLRLTLFGNLGAYTVNFAPLQN